MSARRLALAAAAIALPAAAQAPESAADRGRGTATVPVVAGARYDASGAWRWLMGSRYRDLWTTPVRVPVLDLRTFAGGLTPLRRGGNVQTLALRFRGADGREYNFRSVDKELTPALPEWARETLLDDLRQDVTRAQHPAGPVVAAALQDAAGVLNPGPRLVAMPDDPALGEFRADFAGVWFATPPAVLTLHVARGEDTRVYASFGMPF